MPVCGAGGGKYQRVRAGEEAGKHNVYGTGSRARSETHIPQCIGHRHRHGLNTSVYHGHRQGYPTSMYGAKKEARTYLSVSMGQGHGQRKGNTSVHRTKTRARKYQWIADLSTHEVKETPVDY